MKLSPAQTAPYRRLARSVGLQYVTDESAGIHRIPHRAGFSYVNGLRHRVRNRSTLDRINMLRIPPAWTHVWICASAKGHLQATGRDARGRKQYRYHDRWNLARDRKKYNRMIAFARLLPRIRRRVARDLQRPKLAREKVLATVVRLLEGTLMRVGNDEYARHNHSYGLTTLRDQHVRVTGERVEFSFNGKSSKRHELNVCNRRLAKIVRHCRDLPGSEVFQFIDVNGKVRDIASQDVNDYLREITGEYFTAKDFRTWAGTVMAVQSLRKMGDATSKSAAKRQLVQAIDCVAEQLGNTRAVCRGSYIHPAVLEGYVDRTLLRSCTRGSRPTRRRGLNADEQAVLRWLEKRDRCHRRRSCS
jgi:DNA topoisomerase I